MACTTIWKRNLANVYVGIIIMAAMVPWPVTAKTDGLSRIDVNRERPIKSQLSITDTPNSVK